MSRRSSLGATHAQPSTLQTARLKKAGGSLVMTVPAAARDALKLVEGQEMTVAVEGDRLVLRPTKPMRRKYTLTDLLAEEQAAGRDALASVDAAWVDAKPVGDEIW